MADAITEDAPYDSIADRYDRLWNTKAAHEEEKQLFELIPFKSGMSVLDIGCGTGLFLDHAREHVGHYTGIDPSRKMLDRCYRKHRSLGVDRLQLIHSEFERYISGPRFDLIVALFGSASYINPPALDAIPAMLRSRGRFLLMFYRGNYDPVTYEKTGMVPPRRYPFSMQAGPAQCEIMRFGNYWIVRG
jgi:ubiquinone/menaquinone biosynthesis C-methylase UbiE